MFVGRSKIKIRRGGTSPPLFHGHRLSHRLSLRACGEAIPSRSKVGERTLPYSSPVLCREIAASGSASAKPYSQRRLLLKVYRMKTTHTASMLVRAGDMKDHQMVLGLRAQRITNQDRGSRIGLNQSPVSSLRFPRIPNPGSR